MPPRSFSTSGMQSIRRELQRRRPMPLAPRGSAAKRPSAPPPPLRYTAPEPRPRPPSQEDPSPTASKSPPGSAGRPRPRPSPRPGFLSPSTPPPSRSASSSVYSACPTTLGTDEHLRPGTAVGVRTRTTTLETGEILVFWLRAMIVSPTRGGYEVLYDGNWPPGDPYGTVHVPRRHVRMIESSSSPTTPLPSMPPSSTPRSSASHTTATVSAARNKETRPAPRPTTAGKSLRLIRSLLPEMERHARAA
ncbi:ESX-1 secretion-associated protein EspI-like [Panicum miliaceum]|uniref:ESX-1 secretion-associated protein EspI-like n=1 Tax=Panicum miliaceum TaxID=4540 RepID=A0A3L6TGJ0_PANMI|nr:ESX-1 secretion-associated protein EspI-like [Panicum miliaceum]